MNIMFEKGSVIIKTNRKILIAIAFAIIIAGLFIIYKKAPAVKADDSDMTSDSFAETSYLYESDNLNFSLELPTQWKEDCIISENSSSVSFACKENEDMGGHLFSVAICEDEEPVWPDCEKIGEFDGVDYYIVYPSDIQFSTELEESYNAMNEKIKEIMISFEFKG